MTDRTATPLPAGTYLVGDPCYAFSNDGPDYWGDWLNGTPRTEAHYSWPRLMDAEIGGHRIVGMGTAYGDGVYYDQYGNEYSVDAGMIGVVPIEALEAINSALVDLHGESLETATGLTVVTFDEPFHVSYDNGVIAIGLLEIDTDIEGPDDDDDYEDEED